MILSRVQTLQQLFIIESICADKIYSSVAALKELERLTSISLNHKSVVPKIVSCNIRSQRKHQKDLVLSPHVKGAEVICLQETWLNENETLGKDFDIEEMNKYSICAGHGKGVTTYWKNDYVFDEEINESQYQMLRICSKIMCKCV